MRMDSFLSLGNAYLLSLAVTLLMITGCTKDSNSSDDNAGGVTLLAAPGYKPLDASTYLACKDLFADSKGNKWLVCSAPMGDWIYKFNGTTWEKFTSANTPVPLQTYIGVHTEDGEGGIYFTTHDGNGSNRYLIKYKNGTWSYWNTSGVVGAGEIFFNKADNHLYFYSGYTIEKAALSSNFGLASSYTTVASDGLPYSMFMDGILASGSFYITAENNSVKVSTTGSIMNLTPLENSLSFRSVTASPSGTIYAIVNSSGDRIYRLDGTTWGLIPYTNGSIANTYITQLAIDQSNNVIVHALDYGGSSTLEQGLGKIVNGAIQYYKLNNERILTTAPIAVDKDNAKWVAVFGGLVMISE